MNEYICKTQIYMFSIQYFIFLILNLFETSGIKLIRVRIKNEWLKRLCLKRVMNHVNPLLPSVVFI